MSHQRVLLPPGEARMLVDDDMIREDIDLADGDDRFADVKRIVLPVFYARQDILIEELTRVEHASELSTLKVLSKGVRPHASARPRNRMEENEDRQSTAEYDLYKWLH